MIHFQSVSYRAGSTQILEGITFHVEKGESLAITGASGTGKSSILRIAAGFLPPTSGQVELFGKPLKEDSLEEFRMKISWLPQEPVPGEGNVEEALQSIFQFRANRNIRPGRERILEELDRLSLPPELLQRKMEELSGGEKQRVSLALLGLLDREIWLLDEPTSALDRENRDLVIQYILGAKERTLLIVTHDEELASRSSGHYRLERLQRSGV